MTIRKYSRIGLRRDKNLTDLSNSTEALNNLLDTLVDDTNKTYISEDLDALRGIVSYGMDESQYRQIIGSAERVTVSGGGNAYANPTITYENKLDQIRYYSGTPILFGGDGLTAKYYNANQVFANTNNIFVGDPFKTDNFWQSGEFNFDTKITPEAADSNGGVEWEGYFIPTESGAHTFDIDFSAGFTFEFQSESNPNSYTEYSRIGLTTTLVGSGITGTNQILLTTPSNATRIGIGLSVSGTNIQSETTVTSYNLNSGIITLSKNLSDTINDGNITFTKQIGENTRIRATTYILNIYEKYKIRFRYFVPQGQDASNTSNYITFSAFASGSRQFALRYNYLYSLNYDFESEGILTDFLNNSLLKGGGTVGGSTANSYVKVETSKKVDIRYRPKTSLSEIVKLSVSGSITSGQNILNINNTSNIEIGNYVIGPGLSPNIVRVNRIVANEYVILNQNALSTQNAQTYTFIDHRGFVKQATGSCNNETCTLTGGTTTVNLKSGMIMIGDGVTSYTGIATITTTNTFTISPAQTFGSRSLYFYQSAGLVNDSLAAYCPISESRCLEVSTDTFAGSTVIPITSVPTVVLNNWYIIGPQFDSGISIIEGVTSTSITINTPTVRDLISGTIITASGVNDTSKSICCPPGDTSPPFNPTEDGLETIPSSPSLIIDSGNLSFNSIVGIVSTSNIETFLNTDFSTFAIPIQVPGRTFKILSGTDQVGQFILEGLVLNLDASSYPGSGNSWSDISPTGNTATLNGPTYSSSNGGYFNFDGVDDYILANNTSLNSQFTSPAVSHFTWVYPTSAGQIVTELGQTIINTEWHTSNIEISSSGVFSFSTWPGTINAGTRVTSQGSFNTWYYVGFTYDGTTLTAYVNGVPVGTTIFVRSEPYNNGYQTHYALCAIDGTNMGTIGYAGGRIGSFIVYNRGLSDFEVLQNYLATKTRFGL